MMRHSVQTHVSITSMLSGPRWSCLDHPFVSSSGTRGYPRRPREAAAERSRPRAREGDAMPSHSPAVLQHLGYVELPKHQGSGGFDHAAVHAATGHVYVAHTANNSVDAFDPQSGRHLFSV